MRKYYEMLTQGIINFKKLLLDKYSTLGLDEIDCILLIKMYDNIVSGKNSLDVDSIIKTMTISVDEASERIVRLVNEDFISLEMADMKSPEIVSLESLFNKLCYLLENKEEEVNKNELSVTVKEVCEFVEKELNKVLSPSDLQTIKKWFYDYKYTKNEVKEAILEATKYKNRGVNFVDSTLYKKHNDVKVISTDGNTLELFKKVYDKR